MTYYLAVDIGASSGRHILGYIENDKLVLEEVYRFENRLNTENGQLTWEHDRLAEEVIAGIRRCKEIGKLPKTVAIDTWGVDYVLLDENEQEILPVFGYRDARTDGVPEQVYEIISAKDLYAKTGIARNNFNTIYQLYCDKQSGKLEKARHFLMMPEYLSWRLTGKMANEYTNATTGGLVNAETKQWDTDILETLGIDPSIFLPLSVPGTPIGEFSEAVQQAVGYNATVICAPSHDTASAVAAIPLTDDSMYISSGTWSLVGVENAVAVTTEEALACNFTNEGGVEYRFRFLKNIMGMWLFQNIRKNLDKKYTYDEMMEMAMASEFTELVDCNNPAFTAPDNMIEAIRTVLGKPDLPLGDVLACVYLSLATSYKNAANELERLTGKKINCIQIVGGGSADKYLNRLAGTVSGRKVYTGLKEGTATGNLLAQIMYDKNWDLTTCRELVRKSFEIKEVN